MAITIEAPKTPVEAVTLGLYLALTAPTEEKKQKCLTIVVSIIVEMHLSEHQIDTAKALALTMFQLDSTGRDLITEPLH